MFLKIVARPLEKADTLFGSNTMMSEARRSDRLIYVAINAAIALYWMPIALTAAFLAVCVAWEMIVRPLLNNLLMTALLGRQRLSRLVFFSSLLFANTLMALPPMYALFSGHPLGPFVVMFACSTNLLMAVVYMARHRSVFAVSIAPLTILSLCAPFFLNLDLAGLIAVFALEFMCLIAVLASLHRLRQLTDDIAQESQARAKAEEQNLVKSQFLSNMTHELRTPLNAVIGYSEMMKESAEEDGRTTDQADHDKVIRAANSLLVLINDILDLSKIEAGKMRLNVEPFDVADLVSEAVATATPLVQANGNSFEIYTAPDLGEAETDSFRLNQCLLNLLSNAAKFTKNATVVLSARRERHDGVDWLMFDIADAGIGISDEQLACLFQPFVQADSKITRSFGGTGLGLAITQQISALLGGTTSARSALGRGSKFTLRIPAKLRSTETSEAMPPPHGAPIALVIDDDENMLDIAARQLGQIGFTVLSAASGDQALALACVHKPHIILLDVNLPQRSGWEILAEMRTLDRLVDVPILVVSVEEAREKAIALGACDFLTKPIGRDRLTASVLRYANLDAAPSTARVDYLRAG